MDSRGFLQQLYFLSRVYIQRFTQFKELGSVSILENGNLLIVAQNKKTDESGRYEVSYAMLIDAASCPIVLPDKVEQ